MNETSFWGYNCGLAGERMQATRTLLVGTKQSAM